MTDREGKTEKSEKNWWRRWLRRFVIVFLIAAVLFYAGLAIMSTISGNHESLRLGVQDYLSAATGMRAEIGRFDHMSLFPVLELRMGEIAFNAADSSGPAARVGDMEFGMNFWDMFFSRPSINKFTVKDAELNAGLVSPQRLYLKEAAFSEKAYDDSAGLAISGEYGTEPFTFRLKADRDKRKNGTFYYSRLPAPPFIFEASFLEMRGVWTTVPDGTRLDISSAGMGEASGSGHIVYRRGEIPESVAVLNTPRGQSKVILKKKGNIIEGTVAAPALDAGDTGILAVFRELAELLIRFDYRGAALRRGYWEIRVGKLLIDGVDKGQATVTANDEGEIKIIWSQHDGNFEGSPEELKDMDPSVAELLQCLMAALIMDGNFNCPVGASSGP